uniref:Uncharacterized protein n=1 Tax=Podoviridae sp. ctHPE11 TaxID=2825235 RepID=A0A8S5NW65_9CAUD|nr:MAG TPA: hypothetical protein [Podoviridae sp. ctHPE11]
MACLPQHWHLLNLSFNLLQIQGITAAWLRLEFVTYLNGTIVDLYSGFYDAIPPIW